MKYYISITVIIIVLILSVPGCMMMGMHSGMSHSSHGAHDSDAGNKSTGQMIIKEVIYQDYKLSAEFPPLYPHQETKVSLIIKMDDHIVDTSDKVEFRYTQNSAAETGDFSEYITLIQNSEGNYEYEFTPHQKGRFIFEFKIESIDGNILKKPVSISAERETQSSETMNDNQQKSTFTKILLISGGIS